MDPESAGGSTESWRVVVFTNLPGGRVYTMLDEILRPLGQDIVGVVTTPGPKRRRSSAYLDVVKSVRPGVDVLVSNHPERWAAMLAPLRPDLIISGSFPWRIPIDVLNLPRLGAINIHPALLPRHRGPESIGWAFRSGDSETGLTIHRLAPELDTGEILAQESVPIDDEDDADSLMGKLMPAVPALVIEALQRVERGETGEAQDEAAATYAGLFEDEWRLIDWGRPAREVHNKVRSWIGFRDTPKGAFGEVDGESVLIGRTRLPDHSRDVRKLIAPGTTLQRDGQQLVVQCGDGPIEIIEWSHAGESDLAPASPAQ